MPKAQERLYSQRQLHNYQAEIEPIRNGTLAQHMRYVMSEWEKLRPKIEIPANQARIPGENPTGDLNKFAADLFNLESRVIGTMQEY